MKPAAKDRAVDAAYHRWWRWSQEHEAALLAWHAQDLSRANFKRVAYTHQQLIMARGDLAAAKARP